MKIVNGIVFCDDFELRKKDVCFEGDLITESSGGEALDAAGCLVSPGFVDIHIHGCNGADFCDASESSHDTMAAYLASVGVTSYLGTTMAIKKEPLKEMLACGKRAVDNPKRKHAVMRGVNLEGPFASLEKKAAMVAENLYAPDYGLFCELDEASGGSIRLADVAPEVPGGLEFVKKASGRCVVSVAHSAADYDTAKAAFEAGATHVTHLFNAMSPLSHRAPGVVGAAFDCAKSVELICDGIHIHPSAVRAAFKLFGDDRICLISDAMMACGMPNGTYSLGGQAVNVKDGLATLAHASGTIAGSATALTECFRRAVKNFGIPLKSALRASAFNPAEAVGLSGIVGSITPGKRADFTLFDEDTLEVRHCIIGGELVF